MKNRITREDLIKDAVTMAVLQITNKELYSD
jgi:non-canonical (house-cleaning) NTP pyrophosphatase